MISEHFEIWSLGLPSWLITYGLYLKSEATVILPAASAGGGATVKIFSDPANSNVQAVAGPSVSWESILVAWLLITPALTLGLVVRWILSQRSLAKKSFSRDSDLACPASGRPEAVRR